MQEETLSMRRMQELAERAERTGNPVFTPFLSPPEAALAITMGRSVGTNVLLFGGYEDAERQMACFGDGAALDDFPIGALLLRWPHQSAPGHRDVLGSVMGLGLKRSCMGDIVLEDERGFLFAERAMLPTLAAGLVSAGRIKLQTELTQELPAIASPEGVSLRTTVMSLRLDAVLASGFDLPRTKAAALITSGQVKLRHVPNEHIDARVTEGDVISARGYGRLRVDEIGAPTRKQRLPLVLTRFGR